MMFHPLPDAVSEIPSPACFTYPFCYTPHRLCVVAADEVRSYLQTRPEWRAELSQGKMLGVLVVQRGNERGFLAAFSGTLDGATRHDYFVPPVYDCMEPDGHFQTEQACISALNRCIEEDERRITVPKEHEQARLALEQAKAKMQEARQRRNHLRTTLSAEELAEVEPELIRESQFLKAEFKRLQRMWQQRISEAEEPNMELRKKIAQMEQERKRRSMALQEWLFKQYSFLNAQGERRNLLDIFSPSYPPGGAGDCCAPKLLQAAYEASYTPLCMAEFWVGNSPADELRAEGNFYPSCRSKCLPILGHMLKGLSVEANPLAEVHEDLLKRIRVLHQEDDFLVMSKPSGLLSVPGKEYVPSVLDFVRGHYPQATGPLIVHRLDMDTSGLMVVALNDAAYHRLQGLFLQRKVLKTYLAILEKPMSPGSSGEITLPLAPDIQDRPRQKVDYTHGKESHTTYRVLDNVDGHALVALTPHTGRTHQLRVHCAHPSGLDNPIVGDRLYGKAADRLMLHAAKLAFGDYEFTDLTGLGNYNLSSL